MENASKALLIAGAILIVILLIGIGMLIYSRSTGVVDIAAGSMNAQEIQAFNSQFTPYEGSQRGSSVRALVSAVIANNNTYPDKKVIFAGTDDASVMSTISANLNSAATYSVEFTGYSKGLINTITLKDASGSAITASNSNNGGQNGEQE